MSLGQDTRANRTVTAHSYALTTMRNAILDGTLPGGTRLVQGEIAAQLQLSITPVREALRDLVSEGLVDFDPHRGSYVRRLNLAEVREIYELRITLEPMMIRRVIPKITAEQLERADRLRTRMEQTKDVGSWSELNRQFHELLYSADKETRLAGILKSLRDSASAYVSMSLRNSADFIAQSNAEHAALVRLYRERDVDGAVAFTVRHLETTLARLELAHKKGVI